MFLSAHEQLDSNCFLLLLLPYLVSDIGDDDDDDDDVVVVDLINVGFTEVVPMMMMMMTVHL